MELNINEWKWFKIKEIKILQKPKIKKISKIPEDEGKVAFISSTQFNCGVSDFVDVAEKSIEIRRCLTISTNGRNFDSFVHGNYKKAFSSDVEIFLLDKLSENIGLFLATILRKEQFKYSYGRKAKNRKIDNTFIKLPAKQDGTPDWDFMENYIKWLKEKQNKESISLQTIENTAHLSKATNKLKLNISEWREYNLKDLFNFVKGKCSNSTEFEEGTEAFYIGAIGAKKENHGVMQNIVSESTLMSKGNCIAFVCQGEGSNGYQFYMPVDAIHTTSNTLGYSKQLNKYNALFITTVLDKERFKWS
ncbi:restriction endonuclease subunit S, partial [Mycoplasma sp. 4013]